MIDWTADERGVSNSSTAYREVADAVADLIWSSAHDLIRGNTRAVARLIVAKLAHEHGLAPRETTIAGGGLSEDDIVRIMRESGAMDTLDINEDDVRAGHRRVNEVLPAMRLAYEQGRRAMRHEVVTVLEHLTQQEKVGTSDAEAIRALLGWER